MSTRNRTARATLPALSLLAMLQIGPAGAAAAQEDFQAQVRALLSGPAVAHSTTAVTRTPRTIDAQEFARNLLLGGAASRSASTWAATPVSSAGRIVSERTDSQADVRRLLLGTPKTIS